jgi:hypothetical protein
MSSAAPQDSVSQPTLFELSENAGESQMIEVKESSLKEILLTPRLQLRYAQCHIMAAHQSKPLQVDYALLAKLTIRQIDVVIDEIIKAFNLEAEAIQHRRGTLAQVKKFETLLNSCPAHAKAPQKRAPIDVATWAELGKYTATLNECFGGRFHERDVLERAWVGGGAIVVQDYLALVIPLAK